VKRVFAASASLLFYFCVEIALSQTIAPSRIQWRTSLGSPYMDRATSICESRNGGYLFAPRHWYSSSNSFGNVDAWLFRLDQKGSLIWSNSFGGTSNDWFQDMVETSDGGWLAAGATYSPSSGNKASPGYGGMDYWVVRLDANGNKLWDQTFGGSQDDQLCGISESSNGGFILAGHSFSNTNGNKTASQIYPYGNGYSDIWIIEIDATGEILWQKAYGGYGHDRAYSFQRLASGGFVLAGSLMAGSIPDATRTSYGDFDAWILRLDAEGNKLWEQTFGGAAHDEVVHVSQTFDGGFIAGCVTRSGITGNKTTPNFGDVDYWIIRLDAAGNKVWEQTFGTTGYDLLCNVYETPEGNFIAAGYSADGTGGNKTAPQRQPVDAWLIRLDAHGNRLWDETYGGSYMTTARSMCLTRDGGLVFAGEEQKDWHPDSNDIVIMKLAPDALTAPELRIVRGNSAASDTRLELSGIPGRSYIMESSSDFISWTPFATNVFATNALDFPDSLPDPARRIYRARLMP
jgi:hypothetical protein